MSLKSRQSFKFTARSIIFHNSSCNSHQRMIQRRSDEYTACIKRMAELILRLTLSKSILRIRSIDILTEAAGEVV